MPLLVEINSSVVDAEHKQIWDELKEKWGNISHGGPMPWDERWRASKIVHGMWVLASWNGAGSADHLLRSYGIPEDVRHYIISKYCVGEELGADGPARAPKRADKYSEFEEWAEEHIGEQFTTEQLVEQSGFSHATTLKYLKTSLYFKPIKKGLWEATALPPRE